MQGNVNTAVKDQYPYGFSVLGWCQPALSLLLEREEEDFQQRGAITLFGNPNQDRERDTDSVALEYRTDLSESLVFAPVAATTTTPSLTVPRPSGRKRSTS